MKRILTLVAAASVITAAGSAMAASTSATISVTAQVTGSCSVNSGTLVFPTIDPLQSIPLTANASNFWVNCTNGTVYAIAYASANGDTLKTGAGDSIAYTYSGPAGGTGTGVNQNLTFTGNIAAVAYASKPIGTYTDTITATISY